MESLLHLNPKTPLACGISRQKTSCRALNTKAILTHFAKPIIRSSLSSPGPSRAAAGEAHALTDRTTALVEAYHQHRRLKALINRLQKEPSAPRVLQDDGDWTKDHFWAVVRFLRNSSRSNEIFQVFDVWKNIEKSRINEKNYEKIIILLGEEGRISEAVQTLRELRTYGLKPSLNIYNSIIHGFAREGKFNDAMFFLNEMKERDLAPETDTYDGLIEAYGKYKMYDEIGVCMKKMESDGCSPDHLTYNLLIREFARGGLLHRMERVYQIMVSKRMYLQSSTLIAMLEAYGNFGVLDKMEKVYRKVLQSASLTEDSVRKLARVYIGNKMYSRLDVLAIDLASCKGRNDTYWCLRLLSYARLLSRKGLDSVVREMDNARTSWNVSFANIILLAYLRMKDFTRLRILLSQLSIRHVTPDIITIGILFDAKRAGFDHTETQETWRKMGFLYRAVEMNTDPLVITAFGKGRFLRDCEEAYTSLAPEAREGKKWTYHYLIDMVLKHNRKAKIS